MVQDLNRIKIVLVEKKKTGKWLAEKLGVSRVRYQDGRVILLNQILVP